MTGQLLGMLKPSVVFQVNRDAGRPPGGTSDGGEKTREANFGASPSTLYRNAAGPESPDVDDGIANRKTLPSWRGYGLRFRPTEAGPG
jgi:hypothetical protein